MKSRIVGSCLFGLMLLVLETAGESMALGENTPVDAIVLGVSLARVHYTKSHIDRIAVVS